MFVGHYAASLAAKAAEPRAPLWSYVAGAQLIDIGWSVFILTGVEQARIDPALPGSQLVLYHMPYTHSLPAALVWAVAGALVLKTLLRLPNRAAIAFGLVIFSHWLLDLLVHRPDLELWFGGPSVGFAFWDLPAAEMAVEMGLVALAGAAWVAARKARRLAARPAVAFLTLLVAQQAAFLLAPLPGDIALFGLYALVMYALAIAAAWLVDRSDARRT